MQASILSIILYVDGEGGGIGMGSVHIVPYVYVPYIYS